MLLSVKAPPLTPRLLQTRHDVTSHGCGRSPVPRVGGGIRGRVPSSNEVAPGMALGFTAPRDRGDFHSARSCVSEEIFGCPSKTRAETFAAGKRGLLPQREERDRNLPEIRKGFRKISVFSDEKRDRESHAPPNYYRPVISSPHHLSSSTTHFPSPLCLTFPFLFLPPCFRVFCGGSFSLIDRWTL